LASNYFGGWRTQRHARNDVVNLRERIMSSGLAPSKAAAMRWRCGGILASLPANQVTAAKRCEAARSGVKRTKAANPTPKRSTFTFTLFDAKTDPKFTLQNKDSSFVSTR